MNQRIELTPALRTQLAIAIRGVSSQAMAMRPGTWVQVDRKARAKRGYRKHRFLSE